MRIGITVDSTCDLPREYLDAHRVVVLPTTVELDNNSYADERDPVATLRFYREILGDRVHSAVTVPYSTEQFREMFLSRLVTEFDFVFCLTITSSRSAIYQNAVMASREILRYYHPIRKEAGLKGIFQMRVMDSKTAFAAQAITVLEGVRMIEEGADYNAVRERLEFLTENTYGYMVPRDLFHLRATLVKSKGEARRLADQGGAYVNGERAASTLLVSDITPLAGSYVLLRKGARDYAVIELIG